MNLEHNNPRAAHRDGTRQPEPPAVTLQRRFHRENQALLLLLFLGLALWLVLPFAKGWMAAQASLIIVYVIAAQGVTILTGYTGLVTVGHGGFLAIGAYTSALLTQHFGIDLSLGLIAGGLVAGIVGWLLGVIFLRLSGAFMAIGTLGFAFFIGAIVNNVPLFQGRDGISLPDNRIFGITVGDVGFYYAALAVLGISTLFMQNLIRSPVGRAFKALRDSEKAAETSGINRVAYRKLAFALSATITGVAGVLNGHVTHYVSAGDYGDIWYSVDILVAVIVGGSRALMGPFLGGAFIVMVPFFLEELADFAFILKGVILIAVLQFAPAGICDVAAQPMRALRRWRMARLNRDDATSSAPLPSNVLGAER